MAVETLFSIFPSLFPAFPARLPATFAVHRESWRPLEVREAPEPSYRPLRASIARKAAAQRKKERKKKK